MPLFHPPTDSLELRYLAQSNIQKNYRVVVMYEDVTWNPTHLRYVRLKFGTTLLLDEALTCTNNAVFEYTCILPLFDIFGGPAPDKFYVYFNVEEGVVRTCSNGATTADANIHCNDDGE